MNPRRYKKEFEVKRDIEVGAGVALGGKVTAQVGDETTAKLSMIENDGSPSQIDNIEITEKFQSRTGVKIGTGVGVKLGAGPVTAGAYAGVEGGGYAILMGGANYNYKYESGQDQVEARSKLYNLALAALTLAPDPVISRLAFLLSNIACWDYLEDAKVGVGVKGSVSGSAMVGAFSQRKIGLNMGGIGVGVSGGFSYEFGGIMEMVRNKSDFYRGSLTLFDKANLGVGIGLLTWKYKDAGKPGKGLHPNQIEKTSGFGISVDLPFLPSYDVKRSMILDAGLSNTNIPYYSSRFIFEKSGFTREFSYSFTNENVPNILANGFLKGIFSISSIGNPFKELPVVGLGAPSAINDEILSLISDGQKNNNYPPMIYSIDSSYNESGGGFSLSFEWAIKVDLNFGFDLAWKTSHFANKEKGVFLVGEKFPLEKYYSIPQISTPTKDVLLKILKDGFNTFQLSDLFHSICIICPGGILKTTYIDTTIMLSPIGSTLKLKPSSLPPFLDSLSCQTWNWFGNSNLSKISDLPINKREMAQAIKKQQQTLARVDYGIGGFYKFSPQAIPLDSSATLTIIYPDSDVVGIDENNLAIFYRDTVDSKWHYIGGSVDTLNNKITVSVDTLQLYTIAPIMPDGEFGLKSDRDTLINDSVSIATIISDSLKMADGQLVGDNKKYTIRTENVAIIANDADTTIEGTQVLSVNSKISFQIKSNKRPGKTIIMVESVFGNSFGILTLTVIDTTNPDPPTILNVIKEDQAIGLIVTKLDTSDISQYEVYFDKDSGPPYEGKALVGAENSPFTVPVSDTIWISGLNNDTNYYFAIRGIDQGGNKSIYSNEVMGSPIDTIPPGVISSMDFIPISDSTYLIRWKAPGDNGYYGRASKYIIKISNLALTDTLTWWQNADSVLNVTAPDDAGKYDYHILKTDTNHIIGILVIDEVGNKSMVSIFRIVPTSVKNELRLPESFALLQNYPNPFNPITLLKYQLPVESKVILRIYNILGQEVRTLTDGVQEAGYKSVEWNSTNNFGNTVASGIYFYRIEVTSVSEPSKSFIQVKKMLLLK